MLITPGEILKNINIPADLRKVDRTKLPQVADELRH
jgi:1-deoxy-D-xylulose-5-phosphate synthase